MMILLVRPTIHEIVTGKSWRLFLANGSEHFAYVPCLSNGELGIRVIEAVVRRELMGWV